MQFAVAYFSAFKITVQPYFVCSSSAYDTEFSTDLNEGGVRVFECMDARTLGHEGGTYHPLENA